MPARGRTHETDRPRRPAGFGARAARRLARAPSTLRRGIARFAALPARDRRQVLRALPVVVAVRLALWILPLKTALRLTCRLRDRRGAPPAHPPGVHEITQAVRRAGRAVPKANCLPQALAGQILLGRAGHESEMRIGVRLDAARGVEAHAWLEHQGEVVLGELPDMARFSPMPSLDRYLGRHVPR